MNDDDNTSSRLPKHGFEAEDHKKIDSTTSPLKVMPIEPIHKSKTESTPAAVERDETDSSDTQMSTLPHEEGRDPQKTEKLKSSNVCVLLSLIPIAGIPRMYLGYWKIGIIQFLLSIGIPILVPVIIVLIMAVMDKVFGFNFIANLDEHSSILSFLFAMQYAGWFYCYIESHFLKKDKKGRPLHPGSFWQRIGYILLGIVCLTALIAIPLMGWGVVDAIRHSKEMTHSTSLASLIIPFCMMGVIVISSIGSVIGLIGLVRASKGRFYLHYATKDILMSIPLVVLHWVSIAAALYLSVELSKRGFETASNATMIIGIVLWLMCLWLIGNRVKKCNEGLTKWELVQATCARIFVIFLIQFMSLLALSAIISLKNKQKQVGSTAQLRIGDFLDEGKRLMRTWGAMGKKILPLIIISSICITLTKKVCQLIGKTSSEHAEVDTLGYGVLNLLAVAASIGGMVALVNYVEELPVAPVKPRVQHVEPASVQPAAEQGFDFTAEPEADANQTPEHPSTMAEPAPTAEVSTVTESAPTPEKVDNPMLNNSAEPEQRATADTGAAPRDPQAYEPTGDTPMEQAIAAMAYSFSPEHSIKAELLPLKDGALFKREAQNGEQVTVSAWVKLKFVDKDPRFLSFMESIKNLFAQGATLEKTFPRAVRPVADDTSEETMCRDAGDFAPAQYPAVTYIATDTLLENISADTNLLLLSVGETIYGFSLNDEKSRSYVLYDMLKYICGTHGIFPLRIMVQMKNKNKQVLAEITREDTEDENHGQPMYSLIYSNVAEKEALMIDPSFYGGSAIVYAEPGCLYFQERIVKVTGVISTQAAREAAYVDATIEAPSFKLSKEDICEFAERMEQAEKYDNEKKTASSAAATSPEPQPAPAISAPESMVGKRIRFIYTDTRFRSGEETDDGECIWGNWQTQDLSKADLWVGQVAPSELNFGSSDKAIVKPAGNNGNYMLIGTYTAGARNSATVHRQLAISPNELADESGEYILSFDSPSSGTAALRNCGSGMMHFECENIRFVVEDVKNNTSVIEIPKSLAGKKIRFIYLDARYREGISHGCNVLWNVWQDQNLTQYSGWVALAAPPRLVFSHGNKGIYNPGVDYKDGYIGFILAGTYQAEQGNTARIRRELTFDPDTAGDASGEYILTFDSPTSGTAELKNCERGNSCFECENIMFVIEDMSEDELNSDTEDASTKGGLSKAEIAELEDFLETLMMTPAMSSSTWRLYQGRLMTLLPMIQEGAPVDVTIAETKGNTALHYACGMGRRDIVEWLVNHGADVNKRTDRGATPLDCVSGGYAAEIRRFLIQHGAIKGKKGRR